MTTTPRTPRTPRTPLAVHVGPVPAPGLEAAVRAAGGRTVPLAEAEALVFSGQEPARVGEMVHEGIRWVQLPSAGVERWVEAGVIRDEPVFTTATGAYALPVAEHALALMLTAARGLHRLAGATSWDGSHVTGEFAGSTVAIVGCGGIGRELIRLIEPFGCRVLAVSDSGPVAGAERTVPRASFRDVLPEARYVVLAAPATPETEGMFGAREFTLMRRDAWLVNIARGSLVVTDELVAALRGGGIGGAALDVTEPEPLPAGHALWGMEQVLITPHCANPHSAYWRGLAERVAENVALVASGEPPRGIITTERGF